MRYFNTQGECRPADHYMLPAAARLPDARLWVRRQEYFLIHAPRQSGKTTSLTALASELTAEGEHVAVRFSCESGEPGPDDIGLTELRVLDAIRDEVAGRGFPEEWLPPDPWPAAVPGRLIVKGLRAWALKCPLPLVLFFDEIDALAVNSLNSVLRQIRDGYSGRPHAFPSSIAVCGMRHLRDYKLAAGGTAPVRSGRGSPFNNAVTYRLANFTVPEVAALYAQHTAETGQEFTPDAIDLAYDSTQGQPWLVNAIGAEITDKMRLPVSETITAAHVESATERLIEARAVHLDSLAARLVEPRVRKIIEPIVAGTFPGVADSVYNDDLSYVRDLGLVAPDDPIRIANPVYREVIARVLGDGLTGLFTADPYSLTLPDGRLDVPRMLEEFTGFWLENGEWMTRGTGYNEAGAQIVFMAFLQRMINGDGFVDREFGIGTGRADLLVRRPYGNGEVQREAFELKVWWTGKPDPLEEALPQFDKYLARLRLGAGTLIIFDRRENPAPVAERSGTEALTSPAGHAITLLRR
ncbi:MAG: ATP-binding protein [Nocardiopsaceae bacterium]|nr:ATP-binding protein [Nocardiopsaceae bacterium]